MTSTDIADLAVREAAALWRMRLAEDDLGLDDQAALDAWLAADDRHPVALETAFAAWQGVDDISTLPEVMVFRAQALERVRRANRLRWLRPVSGRWIVAAAAVLVIGISLLVARPWIPTVYRTGVGQRQVVALSDGSRLSLDGDTRVDVRLSDGRRELWLRRGRARFAVAKDPLRPFTVTAGDRTVVATGTAFSVELLHDDINVVLYEGRVAVLRAAPAVNSERSQMPRPETTLSPGQQLVAPLGAPSEAVSTADLSRASAWERGQLVFADEPLASAVERVNRYSTTKLEIGDAAAGRTPISGVFDAGDTQAFVTGVTAVFRLHAEPSDNGWMLSSR